MKHIILLLVFLATLTANSQLPINRDNLQTLYSPINFKTDPFGNVYCIYLPNVVFKFDSTYVNREHILIKSQPNPRFGIFLNLHTLKIQKPLYETK